MVRRVFEQITWLCNVLGTASGSLCLGATHRFDHVEFQSFKGGSTTVSALSNTGLVAGASGGFAPFTQEAFISDATGALDGINSLGLNRSVGRVINDAGQIAGIGSTTADGLFDTAFRFDLNTGMQAMTGLPGRIGDVFDINEQGDVVGYWVIDQQNFVPRAFLFSDANGLQDLGTLIGGGGGGGGTSTAIAVNQSQQVVGSSQIGEFASQHHAFLWEKGTMLDLGTFGGLRSQATDINDAGTVVGWATDANFAGHAFVNTKENGMQPLPVPKDANGGSAALMINETGMILLGYSRIDNSSGMALVMPSGEVIDIPLLGGFPMGSALAMNNLGHIVGGNVLVQGSEEIVSAFYWSQETGTIQLDQRIISNLPWTIFSPVAINDADEILVRSFDSDGLELSALLRPALDGDVNGDRMIDVDDLLGVINAWGECADVGGFCAVDFNNDQVVNVDDLLDVINNWG